MCSITEVEDLHLKHELLSPRGMFSPPENCLDEVPLSKVHASSAEWYKLVVGGVARSMFECVSASEVVRDHKGSMILNGAMGVDKVKVIDSKEVVCLRFISILTPLNKYMRKLEGDSSLLPQAAFLSNIFLTDNEDLLLEGEDLQSCLNLFYLPACWKGFIVFEKQVSGLAFGLSSPDPVYVGLRAVPMGWLNSVDLCQFVCRRFVINVVGVLESLELRPRKATPREDVAVLCMDGFDLVRRVKKLRKVVRTGRRHPYMEKFVEKCREWRLPLNSGKEVVAAVSGVILGGELDGSSGWFRQADEKTHRLLNRTLALLSLKKVSQAAVQHWCGLACFCAGFRRASFSILQDVFAFITGFSDNPKERRALPPAVRDEILIFAVLSPTLGTELRSPLRRKNSISDASEQGGAAAEASSFSYLVRPDAVETSMALRLNSLEELSVRRPFSPPKVCFCGSMYQAGDRWAQCVRRCGAWVCSYQCGEMLRKLNCSGYLDPRKQVGFVSFGPCKVVPWKLMINELVPVDVTHGRLSEELPRVLILWPDVPSLHSKCELVRRRWAIFWECRCTPRTPNAARKTDFCMRYYAWPSSAWRANAVLFWCRPRAVYYRRGPFGKVWEVKPRCILILLEIWFACTILTALFCQTICCWILTLSWYLC